MESERILPVLIFALLVLFQFALPLLRRRMKAAAPPDEDEEAIAPARVVLDRVPGGIDPAPAVRAGSRTPARPERSGQRRPVTPPPAAPPMAASPRRSPVGSIAEVRRGIVLMTILGPCRAAEEPDSRGVG